MEPWQSKVEIVTFLTLLHEWWGKTFKNATYRRETGLSEYLLVLIKP
jgi:hypothetical protein